MPLIIEDEGKLLVKKQAKVPDKLVNKIKQNLNLFGQYKQSKGYKRASSIVDDDYNKRSNKKDKVHNGDKTLSFSDIKKIDHEYKNMSVNDDDANEKNLGFILPGGNDMKNWAHDTLRKMRTSVKKVKGVPPVPKLEKEPVKPKDVNKDIKMGSASIKLTESEEWLPYYDSISDYDTSTILNDFIHSDTDKQQWSPLIQPDMYKKALSEFVKYGKFIHFPVKYVYQWMGIIMNNTAKLRANTEWAGHLDCAPFPMYELESAIEEYPNFFKNAIEEFGMPNEDNCYDFMDNIGFFDWMNMPDGSDAWSDYGLPTLERVISEYRENMSPEETIVIINKVLDCAHPRGDLSSIFIVGGSKTLSAISESIKRSKKIIVNEGQLLALKEYHDQLAFNFDDEGYAYFEKNNWEHYVDFLEDIGKPGMLPQSQWDDNDIARAVEKAKEEIDYQSNDLNEDYYIEAFLDLVYDAFIFNYHDKEDLFTDYFLEHFNDYEEFKEKNNYYDESYTLERFLRDTTDILDDVDNLDNYLTHLGYGEYTTKLKEVFLDKFGENDMLSYMTKDERGLIYVERNIKIPKFNSPVFGYDRNSKDYYKYLKKTYFDLGYCFSWDKDAGEAYCGSSFGGVGTSEIKLKCWVDPKDINWYETVYRNCYSLREEKEVYINASGAKVEVFDVVLEYGETNGVNVSGKSLMKTPIIIEY